MQKSIVAEQMKNPLGILLSLVDFGRITFDAAALYAAGQSSERNTYKKRRISVENG
jgi:hypothetical protein